MIIIEENLVIRNEATSEEIKSLIYTIRGRQVMLDSDVAMLYQYKTKVLNLTVKRNIERFPEEFCFRLTEEELKNLRCQIETSNIDIIQKDLNSSSLRFQNETLKKNNGRGKHRKYLPYAFTEQRNVSSSGLQ